MTIRSEKPFWCDACGRTTCSGGCPTIDRLSRVSTAFECDVIESVPTARLPPVYSAVMEANRRANRETAVSLGRELKSKQAPIGSVQSDPTDPKDFDLQAGGPGLSIEEVLERLGSTASEQTLVKFLTGYLDDSVFAQRIATCMGIMKRKNADYSQGEQKGDRIAAFKRIARDIDMPVRKVWAVFAQKHWGAVMKYVKDGIVESEPIDGRINDLINYLVLFGAIVDEESGKASK